MARATSRAASDAPRDAVALLKQDHRTVKQLFDDFEQADEDQMQVIADRVCQLLTVHAQIEEEILYPSAKETLENEEELDLVSEADVEHQSVKDLIAKIEHMSPEDEPFRATVKVLGEYVKHHVNEEEGELFPALKKTQLDLKDMGERLNQRKMALMQEMGIEEEVPEPSSRTRSTARSGRTSASKARQARTGSRSKGATRSGGRAARH